MPRLLVLVPVVAGVVMFAWALGHLIDDFLACDPVPGTVGVSGWAAFGVFLTLAVSGVGAGILARRLAGWRGLLGALVTLVAIVLGAELGYAIALFVLDCEGTGEGPGLTVAIFSVPAAVVGYAIGWILRQADERGSTG